MEITIFDGRGRPVAYQLMMARIQFISGRDMLLPISFTRMCTDGMAIILAGLLMASYMTYTVAMLDSFKKSVHMRHMQSLLSMLSTRSMQSTQDMPHTPVLRLAFLILMSPSRISSNRVQQIAYENAEQEMSMGRLYQLNNLVTFSSFQ